MQNNVDTDVASDPRVTECLQLIRGFAETILSYVEQVTGKKLSNAALTATDQIEQVLRTRIEGMVNDHVVTCPRHAEVAAMARGAPEGPHA